jgi:hypothetical protein
LRRLAEGRSRQYLPRTTESTITCSPRCFRTRPNPPQSSFTSLTTLVAAMRWRGGASNPTNCSTICMFVVSQGGAGGQASGQTISEHFAENRRKSTAPATQGGLTGGIGIRSEPSYYSRSLVGSRASHSVDQARQQRRLPGTKSLAAANPPPSCAAQCAPAAAGRGHECAACRAPCGPASKVPGKAGPNPAGPPGALLCHLEQP